MYEAKDEIVIKDKKALLASLREDIIQASTALTKIHAEKKQTHEDLARVKNEQVLIEDTCRIALAEVQREKEYAKNLIQDAQVHVTRMHQEIAVLNTQKKESMSELRKLNEWVFTAEEAKNTLIKELADLEKQAKAKESYIADLSHFKALKEEAEKEYRVVLVETRLAIDESEALKEKSDTQVSENKKILTKIESDLNVAKEELRKTQIHDNRVREELKIYVERVEKAHSAAFPKRTMKLTQR